MLDWSWDDWVLSEAGWSSYPLILSNHVFDIFCTSCTILYPWFQNQLHIGSVCMIHVKAQSAGGNSYWCPSVSWNYAKKRCPCEKNIVFLGGRWCKRHCRWRTAGARAGLPAWFARVARWEKPRGEPDIPDLSKPEIRCWSRISNTSKQDFAEVFHGWCLKRISFSLLNPLKIHCACTLCESICDPILVFLSFWCFF